MSWYDDDNDVLISSYGAENLFHFDLTRSMSDLEDGYTDFYDGASWTASLTGFYNRNDSIALSDRGRWFDGKYDYLQFNGVIPPRFAVFFITKAYSDGTLLSTNAIHDEANQHLITAGIRGKRLESSVQYGDDLMHPDSMN